VFENRVQRRVLGPRRHEVMEWRRLHKELNDLYSSPTVIWVIKSRWLMACMGRGEVHIGFWWGNKRERDPLEDSGVDGRIMLKLDLQ
jgi:hypothetical protein